MKNLLSAGFADEVCTFAALTMIERRRAGNNREYRRNLKMTGRNVGKTCRTHYRGTFNDGTQFDSSYDRGEPLEFVCGAGQMIKGFAAAVADMEVGEVYDARMANFSAYARILCSVSIIVFYELTESSSDIFSDTWQSKTPVSHF